MLMSLVLALSSTLGGFALSYLDYGSSLLVKLNGVLMTIAVAVMTVLASVIFESIMSNWYKKVLGDDDSPSLDGRVGQDGR
jgi:hypothetical protein